MTKTLALKGWIVGIIAFATFIPFGISNIIIAMASILLVPELAKDDHTTIKWLEVFKIGITCFVLSVAASIFTFNIYIGTIITFIIGFYIYYVYTYEDRESKSMIFMIYYILILSIPVKPDELLIRIFATIYGVILAMALYFLLFKLNFIQIANKNVIDAYNFLNQGIDKKLKKEIYESDMINALNLLQKAENLLIKKAEKGGNQKHKIGEKILILELIKSLGNIIYKTTEVEMAENLKCIIDSLVNLYKEEISLKDFEKQTKDKILELTYDKNLYEHITIEKSLEKFFENYENISIEENYRKYANEMKSIAKKYSKEFNLDYKFTVSMKSIKFNTAIKGSVLTALAVFIVFYFKIPDGRWLLYTITVVYLPFADQSVNKLKQRILGTAVGFIVFDIILSISQNTIYIGIILLISLYFSIYLADYGKRCISITFTGVASQYIVDKAQSYYILSFYRIGYVILGCVIAYIVIKYIFPIDVKHIIKNIYNGYEKLNINIIKNIKNEEKQFMTIEEILIINRLLWIKANFVNDYAKNENLNNIMRIESFIVGEYKYMKKGKLDELKLRSNFESYGLLEVEKNIELFKQINI